MTTTIDQRLHADLPGDLAELKPLVEVSQAAQQEILEFRERYDRLGAEAPLPPKSLREMREGRRRYLNVQDQLADIATRYVALADSGKAARVDPLLRFQGLSVSLIAALTLYDNYLSLLTILKDERLRRLLNHPDYGYGIEKNSLYKIVEGLNSKKARRILRQLMEAWTEADETLAPTDPTSVELRSAVESSVSYRHARDASLSTRLPTKWAVRRVKFMDEFEALSEDALGAISKVFGNGIGLVEFRDGKLRKAKEVRKHLLGLLQPLDLLLEKTPFRLTDYFIPGHFGHAAIWMGTDPELEALGVWDLPDMQREPLQAHRKPIRDGQPVLEALRTGVALNSLKQFLNVDDVAILRPTRLSRTQIQESLVRGFRQIGKEYDFNFDIETTGTIVCSELPYHVYPSVKWPTDEQMGRFTISPDDVASRALGPDGEFELIVFYHDGKRVDDAADLERMRALMQDA